MDWYKHYIGDYARDTAHLTLLQHGVYRSLLCHYYATESVLPKDIKLIYRIIRANSRHERDAVKVILNDFFELRDDGYFNSRVNNEIKRYKSRSETAKQNASNTRNQKPETRYQSKKEKENIKRKRTIPDNFGLSEGMIKYAASKQITDRRKLESFTDKFILACQAKNYKYADFESAWKTWLRNDLEKGNIAIDAPMATDNF